MMNKTLLCLLLVIFFQNLTYAQPLEGELFSIVQSQKFSGSVVVSKGDDIILKSSQGFTDDTNSNEINGDTKFGLASLGKLFTQVAILQLAQAKNLSLDKPIKTYLEFIDDPALNNATINDLLFHKSGLGHYWNNKIYKRQASTLDSLHKFIPIINSLDIEFEPGSSYKYSNAGYIILGLIIEKVSGLSYFDYINNHITGPLQMRSTSFAFDKDLDHTFASPITTQPDTIAKRPRGGSDGGSFSTINDLSKLIDALFIKETLISSELVNHLISNGEENTRATYELTGGFPGNSTALLFDKSTNYWMLALSNTDPPSAENLLQSFIKCILSYSINKSKLELTGLVKDSKTGKPIPYVNIGIINKGIGTASNEHGKYKLSIPKSRFNDSLTFSAIGYKIKKFPINKILNNDSLEVHLVEIEKELDEVVVRGQKMMSTKEGVSMITPFYSWAYIGGGEPGATLLTLLEIPKSPSYLHYIKVHVTGNKKEKPFKLRLRILKVKNDGMPGEDVLDESIVIQSSINQGWVNFELPKILTLDSNVFIGVEWIEEPNNKVNRRTAYPKISVISNKNTLTYSRRTSLDKWEPMPLKLAAHAYLEF